MIVVAFTVSCQRQSYLRRALESWAKVRGVQDAHLLFCLEPPGSFPVPEFQRWACEQFAHVTVEVSPRLLGCSANTRHSMSQAFGLGADFAVLAEEDMEVSTDILEYFAWAEGHYRCDGRVKTVCGHALRCAPSATADLVTLVPWFNPLAWGTWPDRWPELSGEWDSGGWDHALRMRMVKSDWLSAFTVRSRALHIGKVSTVTGHALSQYFYEGSTSSCFIRTCAPQDYREHPRTPELELVV